MSNKRSLHMFQQGSPKRRRSDGPQVPETGPTHHKYPTGAGGSDTHPVQQQSTYQPSYHSFQSNQHLVNSNFYNVPTTSNSNNPPPPHPFHLPPNNLGYNPTQKFSAQSMSAQSMSAQNSSAQDFSAHNSVHGVRIAPQSSVQTAGSAREMYSFQRESCYSGGSALINQQPSMNRANNIQHQNAPPQHRAPQAFNNPQNSHTGEFRDKSLLYRLNHQDPGPGPGPGPGLDPGAPRQSYQSNSAPIGSGIEQYHNSGIRYYNPPPDPRYTQQPGTVQHGTVQHGTVQHGTVQHGTHHPFLQTMTSSNSWDYAGPPPVPNHRSSIITPGNQTSHGVQYNNTSQPRSLPKTEYKIDSACHQRQISKNSSDDLNKSENKTGEKRKNTVSEGDKLACGRKRLITCNISAMLHWAKLKHSSLFLFEIFACLRSAERRNGVSYKLELRDGENNELNADYYLSSTAQPELVPGKYYRLVGKMMNSSFHCFKLKEVPYMETRNAVGLIKQSETAMSRLILQINET